MEPRNQYLLFDLATCYHNHSDLPIALYLMDSAIAIDSTNAAFYHNRGMIYSNLGEVDKSILDYLKAIELKNDPSSHLNLSFAYYQLKKFHLACIYIKRAEALGLNLENENLINEVKKIKRKCN